MCVCVCVYVCVCVCVGGGTHGAAGAVGEARALDGGAAVQCVHLLGNRHLCVFVREREGEREIDR